MLKNQILDLDFIRVRGQLLELAAFLDRMDRAAGVADFRLNALKTCLPVLNSDEAGRARVILAMLSDPTLTPAASAGEKGASGAYAGATAKG